MAAYSMEVLKYEKQVLDNKVRLCYELFEYEFFETALNDFIINVVACFRFEN